MQRAFFYLSDDLHFVPNWLKRIKHNVVINSIYLSGYDITDPLCIYLKADLLVFLNESDWYLTSH